MAKADAKKHAQRRMRRMGAMNPQHPINVAMERMTDEVKAEEDRRVFRKLRADRQTQGYVKAIMRKEVEEGFPPGMVKHSGPIPKAAEKAFAEFGRMVAGSKKETEEDREFKDACDIEGGRGRMVHKSHGFGRTAVSRPLPYGRKRK
jgi:hypothetical protein